MCGEKKKLGYLPPESPLPFVTKSSMSVNGIIISSGSKKETYNLTCSVKASELY